MNNIEKFDGFLDRMQGLLDNAKKQGHIIVRVEDLENTFPELKESEDERIRKELLDFCKNRAENYPNDPKYKNISSWIAWLEKQNSLMKCLQIANARIGELIEENYYLKEKQCEHAKFRDSIQVGDKVTRNEDGVLVNLSQLKRVAKPAEVQGKQKPVEPQQDMLSQEKYAKAVDECIYGEQKPADKVEPNFKAGDWVVHHGTENIYQVVAVIDNQYQLKYGDNYTIQNCADVDRCARLWDITKDAKDGDVLADNGAKIIFIFKNIEYDSHIESNVIKYFIRYSFDGINLPLENGGHLGVVGEYSNFVPATKEQRDILEKAMADAGYTFDFECKELKKIEQIASWSEEDEDMIQALNACIDDAIKSGMTYIYFDSKSVLTGKIKTWLKSLKERFTWKPSDEQMEGLLWVLENCAEREGASKMLSLANSIYDALKKLKG